MVEMTNVSSSNIQSIGYDLTNSTLYVRFHNGGIYSYMNVPEYIYNGIMRAPSKGEYFWEHIRDRFPYRLG